MTISKGKATISNDGATILKLLDVVHPAAKTLVDIARSQDAEVRGGGPADGLGPGRGSVLRDSGSQMLKRWFRVLSESAALYLMS